MQHSGKVAVYYLQGSFMAIDRKAIERITAGDAQHFSLVIEQYKRLVYNIVFRMLANDADREDLCQDIFLKVYQNLPGFHFDAKLSTWIARIAFNTCVNHLKKRRVALFEDAVKSGDSIEDWSDSGESPQQAAEKLDISEKLEREIRRLPPAFRTVLTLYHLEHMSYAEIGKVLAKPDGTVKSYLFRARKLLKDKLSDYYTEEALWERGQ